MMTESTDNTNTNKKYMWKNILNLDSLISPKIKDEEIELLSIAVKTDAI